MIFIGNMLIISSIVTPVTEVTDFLHTYPLQVFFFVMPEEGKEQK